MQKNFRIYTGRVSTEIIFQLRYSEQETNSFRKMKVLNVLSVAMTAKVSLNLEALYIKNIRVLDMLALKRFLMKRLALNELWTSFLKLTCSIKCLDSILVWMAKTSKLTNLTKCSAMDAGAKYETKLLRESFQVTLEDLIFKLLLIYRSRCSCWRIRWILQSMESM